jgi:hypothetical protein
MLPVRPVRGKLSQRGHTPFGKSLFRKHPKRILNLICWKNYQGENGVTTVTPGNFKNRLMEILAKSAFVFYCLIIRLRAPVVAVISGSLVRALVGLIGVMIAVAGMYLLLAAPFIAFMQILIYIGGVSVLIFFAIMLSRALAKGMKPVLLFREERSMPWYALLVPAVILSI